MVLYEYTPALGDDNFSTEFFFHIGVCSRPPRWGTPYHSSVWWIEVVIVREGFWFDSPFLEHSSQLGKGENRFDSTWVVSMEARFLGHAWTHEHRLYIGAKFVPQDTGHSHHGRDDWSQDRA
jgi:hypothetical protein